MAREFDAKRNRQGLCSYHGPRVVVLEIQKWALNDL